MDLLLRQLLLRLDVQQPLHGLLKVEGDMQGAVPICIWLVWLLWLRLCFGFPLWFHHVSSLQFALTSLLTLMLS